MRPNFFADLKIQPIEQITKKNTPQVEGILLK
ncbi:hypothetical protein AmaxDRAFT_3747 [Limnospira maxima CS-328]|uniref:Uncharacterized protein n=1 Tax=Limnospira maxima CS-328 TaxID=513049 RepID=B5W4Q3_LIMMA|nr:hypothetical protein AmaxDRAFT_3747 [Limnospira maxima CS-328]